MKQGSHDAFNSNLMHRSYSHLTYMFCFCVISLIHFSFVLMWISTKTGISEIIGFYELAKTNEPGDNNKTATILLWTPWFGDASWNEMFRFNDYSDVITFDDALYDPKSINVRNKYSCRLVTNRSRIHDSTAVVFHGPDFNAKDMPNERLPWQRYIYFFLEPPNNPKMSFQATSKMTFNWSMSYLTKSDIHFPYGEFFTRQISILDDEKRRIESKILHFVKDFSKRPVDAVWIVSKLQRHAAKGASFI